ncbi:hypothetical protein UR09_03720 [Candidatus Nitromaritima sp. SCGC AAA799-A02]|nr:hypothetical protein UR09_03720 [Candidatus Nitromaritima sp. SCGC AAA799-A02]
MAYWDRGYPRHVSVAEKKAKAARKREALMKKNPGIKPVLLPGRTLARTWWGKSWNKNLERYADYSNRIERGRSYVRHGAVFDLQISPGQIKTLVQGSRSKPYSVVIEIKKLNKNPWKKIKAACESKLESLQELLMGEFPKTLGEVFMQKETGLFPSPKEINFSCSCPDWADMCKHVAASLYGAGARLDEEPHLFFKLRQVEIDDLVTKAVEDRTSKLLKKAEKKSARVLDDSRLSELFGIEMEKESAPKTTRKKTKNKALRKKASSKSKATKNKQKKNPRKER